MPDVIQPYRGLSSFTEAEREFFCGREEETLTLTASVLTRPLTILYGAPGAGKSSLLDAGVMPALRERKVPEGNGADLGVVPVVFRDWHLGAAALPALKRAVVAAFGAALPLNLSPDLPFDELLAAATRAQLTCVVLLDQFEEYFESCPDKEAEIFDTELARAINRQDVEAHVLICLRHDALAGLDRYQARIAGVFDHATRLDHLDEARAALAIRRPIEIFNARHGCRVTIDDELVMQLVQDLRVGHIELLGADPVATRSDGLPRVETAYLQLVLDALWHRDAGTDAPWGDERLKLQSYRSLGGATAIVHRHFDDALRPLNDRQRQACAMFFERIVTPSGAKLPFTEADAEHWSGSNLAGELHVVLGHLTAPRVRLLRPLPPLPGQDAPRYEVFHDLLCPVFRRWAEEQVRARATTEFGDKLFETMGELVAQQSTLQEWANALEEGGAQTVAGRWPSAEMAARLRKLTAAVDRLREPFFAALDSGKRAEIEGDTRRASEAYRRSLAWAKRLVQLSPARTEWQRCVWVALDRVGIVECGQGNLSGALEHHRASLEIVRTLAARDEGNTQWQRDMSVSLDRMGDIEQAHGNLGGALEHYRASLEIRRTLAAQDAANTDWQRGVSVSLDRMGDIEQTQGNLDGALEHYRASLEIRRTLAAQDAANTEWQRDVSVSLHKVGDIEVGRGNLSGALEYHRASLGIAQTLAGQDASNTEWQRDVSVSLDRVGDIERAQGNLRRALEHHRAGLEIGRTLAIRDAGNTLWQRDVSVGLNKVGDIERALGNLGGALENYRASLEIRRTLAVRDSGNAQWQRDVSVSLDKVGDIEAVQGNLDEALQHYRTSLGIRRTLAERDAGNMQWQRDVSVSLNKVGDMKRAQGKLDEALEHYRASLEIRNTLAARDAGNASWRRDVSVTLDRVGAIMRQQGDMGGALEHYQASLEIARTLVAQDAGNTEWQRDVFVSLAQIGSVHRQGGSNEYTRFEFGEARQIVERLLRLHPGHPRWTQDLEWVDAQLASLPTPETGGGSEAPRGTSGSA